MREGALVGLTPKDFKRPPSEGTLICTLAWARIASNSSWLEAVSSSAVLEIANSDAIIKGGGIAHRFARKMARDIKIPIRKQPSNVEHIAVDIEHANLLFQVIKDHVKTREDEQLVLSGAAKGLAVNAAWLGFLARDMETLGFNTAIARLQELNNTLTALHPVPRSVAEVLIRMLAPLAPHIAEELWSKLGHGSSIAYEPFPEATVMLTNRVPPNRPTRTSRNQVAHWLRLT